MSNCMLVLCGLMLNGAAAEPYYRDALIFPPQEKHVHSSSIAECPNGDLLACWFHGSGERQSPDVVVQGARLTKDAAAWSPVFPMADTPHLPDCNPVLFVDPGGQLWLFWIAVLAGEWDDSLLRYRTSTDFGGEGPPRWQWQDDMILDPGPAFPGQLEADYREVMPMLSGKGTPAEVAVRWKLKENVKNAKDLGKRQRGWMPRAQVVVLPSGRILLPLYSDAFLLGLMAISDDRGKSWRPSAPVVGACLNQPSVARKKDGTLVAYMREEDDLKHRALVSESKDDGETWSVARWTDIPNPNASLVVLTLRDGRWVMAFNDSETSRDTLALALSDDEGASWKWTRHIERRHGGSFHYPFLIQARDGLIHITYTHYPGGTEGKSIKHAAFNPEWILAGD